MKTKSFKFIDTPGHGYLEVSFAEIQKYGVADKISGCSFVGWDKCYLEEDCDAPLFLNAVKESGVEVNLKRTYVENPRFKETSANFKPELLDIGLEIGSDVKLLVNSSVEDFKIDSFDGQNVIVKNVKTGYRLKSQKQKFHDCLVIPSHVKRIEGWEEKADRILAKITAANPLVKFVSKQVLFYAIYLNFNTSKVCVNEKISVESDLLSVEVDEDGLGVAINPELTLFLKERNFVNLLEKLVYCQKVIGLEEFASELPYLQITNIPTSLVDQVVKTATEHLGHRVVLDRTQGSRVVIALYGEFSDFLHMIEPLEAKLLDILGEGVSPNVSIEFP